MRRGGARDGRRPRDEQHSETGRAARCQLYKGASIFHKYCSGIKSFEEQIRLSP